MAGKEKGVDKRHGNHDGYSDEYEDMKSEVEEDRLAELYEGNKFTFQP